MAGEGHDPGRGHEQLKALDHFHAVEVGQADVENYHLGLRFRGQARGFFAFAGFTDDGESLFSSSMRTASRTMWWSSTNSTDVMGNSC